MRTLVLRAHPLDDSFNAAWLERTLVGLSRARDAVDLLDLYADDFDPRATYLARYHMNMSTPASRAAYLEKVERTMAGL
jgi:putative NADPH-quinone reductase